MGLGLLLYAISLVCGVLAGDRGGVGPPGNFGGRYPPTGTVSAAAGRRNRSRERTVAGDEDESSGSSDEGRSPPAQRGRGGGRTAAPSFAFASNPGRGGGTMAIPPPPGLEAHGGGSPFHRHVWVPHSLSSGIGLAQPGDEPIQMGIATFAGSRGMGLAQPGDELRPYYKHVI